MLLVDMSCSRPASSRCRLDGLDGLDGKYACLLFNELCQPLDPGLYGVERLIHRQERVQLSCQSAASKNKHVRRLMAMAVKIKLVKGRGGR